jgi:heat-inducible transcriptional repressor
VLSRFSSGVGLVVAPEIRRIVVERVEFARLGGRRVMAIVVGRSGVVHHRMLEVDPAIDQEELDRVCRYLNDEFRGMTLPRMRDELLRRMSEERARLDRLVSRSLELGRQAIEVEDDETELFVEGTANLVDHPEFADVGRMRSLLSALDEKTRLVQLLGHVLDGGGVQVLFGSEEPDAPLDGISLVASRYRAGERALGSIGIVGPTRMSYVRAIALVDHLARRLTELLTDPDTETPEP